MLAMSAYGDIKTGQCKECGRDGIPVENLENGLCEHCGDWENKRDGL